MPTFRDILSFISNGEKKDVSASNPLPSRLYVEDSAGNAYPWYTGTDDAYPGVEIHSGSDPLQVTQVDAAGNSLAGSSGVAVRGHAILNSTLIGERDNEMTPERAKVDLAASGDVIAAVPGYILRVVGIHLTVEGNGKIKWQSGGATDLTGDMTVKDGGGFSSWCPWGLFETASGEKLNLVITDCTSVDGVITYIWVTPV